MKLKDIKQKINSEKEETEYLYKLEELVKNKSELPEDEQIFYLGYWHFGDVMLCGGKIYVARLNKTIFGADVKDLKLTELHIVKIHKEYPKTEADIEVKTIIDDGSFNKRDFLCWIDEPCDINERIDAPFYKVIRYFCQYKKETFSDERYCFYSKCDNDYSCFINFYAYDKKLKTEIKLYILDKWSKEKNCFLPPEKPQDIVVNDLSGRMSLYQQRQCKKAFLKIANEKNEFFNVENYWVIELVNLAIHTHYDMYYKDWCIHRIFCRHKTFRNLWVQDVYKKGEESYFMFIDEEFMQVAAFKFKSAEYALKGIYKDFCTKIKIFEPDKEFLKEMTEFLKAPSERAEETSCGGPYDEAYKKYVKTNWQQLIFEYNHNTVGWGWDENGFALPPEKDNFYHSNTPALPFDLPIPDYTELAKENL